MRISALNMGITTMSSMRRCHGWGDKKMDFEWFESQPSSSAHGQGTVPIAKSFRGDLKPSVPCIGKSHPMNVKETPSIFATEQGEIPVMWSDSTNWQLHSGGRGLLVTVVKLTFCDPGRPKDCQTLIMVVIKNNLNLGSLHWEFCV